MERILTSIDVGTSKVCTTIAKMGDGCVLEVLGTGIVPSHGIHKAIVLNIVEPTAAIKESVREAERGSGTQVKSAYIGITGSHIQSFNNRANVPITRDDHRVTQKDLDRVMRVCRDIHLSADRKLIHAIPRQYYLDGESVIGNPVGLHGHSLGVESHLVTAGITFIQNLIKCVQGAGVGVMDLILEPLASGEAVLEDDEREAGVILADIGGGTTDITVFKGKAIWHSRALAVGGYNVTKDIALGLGLPFNVAEEFKVRYGSVRKRKKGMPEIVSLDGNGKNGVNYDDLSYIIKARIEETLRMIFSDLPRAEWDTWEPASLVLCGGTARLPGIEVLAREVLRQPVRIGKPKGLPAEPAILDDPAYATGVGLLLWGAKYGQSTASSEESLLRRLFAQLTRWRLSLPWFRFRWRGRRVF